MPAKKQTGTASKEQVAKTLRPPQFLEELTGNALDSVLVVVLSAGDMVVESQLQSDRYLAASSILPELRPRRSRFSSTCITRVVVRGS